MNCVSDQMVLERLETLLENHTIKPWDGGKTNHHPVDDYIYQERLKAEIKELKEYIKAKEAKP